MFDKFENKYIFEGELQVLTAIHIGSGMDNAIDDAPFIRMSQEGSFYIPGSSFRGYLRTKIERLLSYANNFDLSFNDEKYEKIDLDINNESSNQKPSIVENIFGYTRDKKALAGKIHVQDMLISTPNNQNNNFIDFKRDGIQIDRNTGTTKKGGKFDYNVITRGHTFNFKIEFENIKDNELALILIGLNDILSVEGDIFGGKTSRGIGRCRLKDLRISFVNSKDKKGFEEYLFKKKMCDISLDKIKEDLFSKIEVK